jgi:hypothetical protein
MFLSRRVRTKEDDMQKSLSAEELCSIVDAFAAAQATFWRARATPDDDVAARTEAVFAAGPAASSLHLVLTRHEYELDAVVEQLLERIAGLDPAAHKVWGEIVAEAGGGRALVHKALANSELRRMSLCEGMIIVTIGCALGGAWFAAGLGAVTAGAACGLGM